MKTKILKMHPDAVVPRYETPGAMAFDLTSVDNCMIWPGKMRVIDTGIAIEPPEGYGVILNMRSSSSKGRLILANMQGWIDPDYRGSLKIALRNVDPLEAQTVQRGERIAQAMIVPVFRTEFEVVDQLTPTARGDGSYGSTGTGLEVPKELAKGGWGADLGDASPSDLNLRFRKSMYCCRNCQTTLGLSWYRGTATPVCGKLECIAALDAKQPA